MIKYSKHIIGVILAFIIAETFHAQQFEKAYAELEQRGEIYIRLKKNSINDFRAAGRFMSIDRLKNEHDGSYVYAYLSLRQFDEFKNQNLEFELLTPPSMTRAITMCQNTDGVKQWDCYPTYNQYLELMYAFETNFPGICKVYEIGESVQGRKLLAVKISDNVQSKEEEPGFFYTSSMHGDETTGYVLMLRLINYLLENYSSDERVSDLINNTEIWINPMSNPDGTYYAGNNTLIGARRGNYNNYDLNRNFPYVPNGEGYPMQKETQAMIDFHHQHHFILSANFHGGAEVVNYPWDMWTSYQRKHADDLWFREISHQYADTVFANSTDYLLDVDNSGITNGGDWYTAEGTMQDYVNYFVRGREVTIEISSVKMPDPAEMEKFWNYNYRSFLNYMQCVHKGVYGKITDEQGNPLQANVTIKNYDTYNSDVFSDSVNGMYYRLLPGGTFDFSISKPGYKTQEFQVQRTSEDNQQYNIVLQIDTTFQLVEEYKLLVANPFSDILKLNLAMPEDNPIDIQLIGLKGNEVYRQSAAGVYGTNLIDIPLNGLTHGIYFLNITCGNFKVTKKLVKLVK